MKNLRNREGPGETTVDFFCVFFLYVKYRGTNPSRISRMNEIGVSYGVGTKGMNS